jgi:hypothetical protein
VTSIETTPGAVVVEGGELGVGQAKSLGDEPRRPFSDAVERLAGEEHVLEQERDTDGGIDPAASIGTW